MPGALDVVHRFFPNVKAVKDAGKDLDVEVTKRDAESKAVRNHKECALAVACKRAQGVDGVIIAVKVAYLIKGDTATRYFLPESVSREVLSFDRNAGFAPGEYHLCQPKGAQKLGYWGRRESKTHVPGNGKKKPGYRHMTEGIRRIGEE